MFISISDLDSLCVMMLAKCLASLEWSSVSPPVTKAELLLSYSEMPKGINYGIRTSSKDL